MKLIMMTRIKFLKAQVREFFVRKRYVGSYPRAKRAVTVMFLVMVNAFVMWQVSIDMPEISISLSGGSVEYQNPALAKIVETVEAKAAEKKFDVVDYIFMKESSRGVNNYSQCEKIGKFNRYGFGIPGDGSYLCFEKGDDTKATEGWVLQKQAAGMTDKELLCLYNTGTVTESCKYVDLID